MAFFEDLGKKISQTSQDVLQKTKDSAEILKLNGMVSDETKKLNAIYTELGKKYFEIHSDSPDEALGDLVAQVKDSQKKIDEYSDQVKKLKGVIKCLNCGGDVQYGTTFCTRCGARVTEPAAETPAETNARICAKCGKEVDGESAFCIFCGAKLEEAPAEAPKEAPAPQQEPAPAEEAQTDVRVCPNCNFEITDDSAFCVKCGTKL